jgi:hypothetical protein
MGFTHSRRPWAPVDQPAASIRLGRCYQRAFQQKDAPPSEPFCCSPAALSETMSFGAGYQGLPIVDGKYFQLVAHPIRTQRRQPQMPEGSIGCVVRALDKE